MYRIICIAMIVLASSVSQASKLIEPKVKTVTLKETTTMTLPIVPDSGTRLVFPFKLDNPELDPGLKIKLTNSTGFDVPDTDKELLQLKDQNTLTIIGNRHGVDARTQRPPIFLGTLYISIGGYNLTINLRTSLKPSDQISDVIFNISEEDREHMVEKAIKRHTAMLDKDHKQRVERLDEKAREYALGYVGEMALKEPSYDSFKVEGEVKLGEDRLIVYAEELVTFNETYHVFLFDIENRSTRDYKISSWVLTGFNDADSEKSIQGQMHCNRTIKSDESYRCSFSTLDSNVLDYRNFSLKITSDRGEGVFKW